MTTDDLLARAETIGGKLDNGELHWQEYKQIVPDLIVEVKRLQEILREVKIDEEVIDWARDGQTLDMLPDMPIVVTARKWHQAYRKAQNSNLVRKRQNEQQADYISRLEAAYMRAAEDYYIEALRFREDVAKEHARESLEQIKRLEDALVEERAKHVAVSRLTDEQRQAIDVAVQIMENEISELSGEEYMGAVHVRTRIESHAAVLRAMLEETA